MIRMRVQYTKTGAVRYTSHLDTVRMFQRGFRAAGMPMIYSQGYHPHPRMSFAPPLKTGWEGLDEYVDCFLDAPVDGIADLCNPHLPEGVRITGCRSVPLHVPKLPVSVAGARFRLRVPLRETDGIEPVFDGEETALLRPFEGPRSTEPEKQPAVLDLAVSRGPDAASLEYTCTMREGSYITPERVARDVFAIPEEQGRRLRVERTKLFVKHTNHFISPLDEGTRHRARARTAFED